MYFKQNLRVQVQQYRNRLYKAIHATYGTQVKYFLDFIQNTPYLRGLVAEMEAQHPGVQWGDEQRVQLRDRGELELHDTEGAAAKYSYGILCDCTDSNNARMYAHRVSTETNFNAMLRDFTELMIDPFVNYLHDQIDEGSNVLYLLEKYKRRVEWFHRDELLTRLRADSRQSEDAVEAHLREYLFDQGIDYPFSQPRSPGGRVDVTADIGEERPLILELKLFDLARGYGKGYLRKGFRQIQTYADDYGQSVGYLVVFNCTPRRIDLRSSASEQIWPPRIVVGHQTFFLVVIDLVMPEGSASKRDARQPYVIEEAYLLVSDVEEDAGEIEGEEA